MFNKVKKLSYAAIGTFVILSTQANALQMNLKAEADVVGNNDLVNVYYDLYYPNEVSVSQQIKGMNVSVFERWINAFNDQNKELTPIDHKGKHSEISLGYRKNDHNYYPESCQHIPLTGANTINIRFSESGCVIS